MSDSVEFYGITATVLLTVVVVAWLIASDRTRTPEEPFPRRGDDSVNPDLYRISAEQYWTMYNEHIGYLHNDGRRGMTAKSGPFRTFDGAREWSKGACAIHGLVARGADSIPYAIELLGRANPNERDVGALILKRIEDSATTDTKVLCALEAALATSSERADKPPYHIGSLVSSLDEVAGISSYHILVQVVKDTTINLDTRYHCIAILDRITDRGFASLPDPVQAIAAWYRSHQANANARQEND